MPTDAQSQAGAHPFTCECKEPFRQMQTHRLLVQNNDLQLPRMSMSLPVFVRSYLVSLWKPNVILNIFSLTLSFCFSLSLSNPLSLDHSLYSEKNQSRKESQASSPTLAAAARLSAMIHGKDRVYANAMVVDQVSRLFIVLSTNILVHFYHMTFMR